MRQILFFLLLTLNYSLFSQDIYKVNKINNNFAPTGILTMTGTIMCSFNTAVSCNSLGIAIVINYI